MVSVDLLVLAKRLNGVISSVVLEDLVVLQDLVVFFDLVVLVYLVVIVI